MPLGSKDGEFITEAGSRDTISPGATLAVANTLLVSFAPRSLNIRALEKAGGLVVDEAAETLRETVVLENASTPLNRLASESPAVPSLRKHQKVGESCRSVRVLAPASASLPGSHGILHGACAGRVLTYARLNAPAFWYSPFSAMSLTTNPPGGILLSISPV